MTTSLDLAWLENPGEYIWRDEFHSLIDRMAEMAKTEVALLAKIARLEMRPALSDPGHTHWNGIGPPPTVSIGMAPMPWSISAGEVQAMYQQQNLIAQQAAAMQQNYLNHPYGGLGGLGGIFR